MQKLLKAAFFKIMERKPWLLFSSFVRLLLIALDRPVVGLHSFGFEPVLGWSRVRFPPSILPPAMPETALACGWDLPILRPSRLGRARVGTHPSVLAPVLLRPWALLETLKCAQFLLSLAEGLVEIQQPLLLAVVQGSVGGLFVLDPGQPLGRGDWP